MKPLALMSDAERALLADHIGVMVEGMIPKGCVFALFVTDPLSRAGVVTSNVGDRTPELLLQGAEMVARPETLRHDPVKGRN